MRIGLAILGLGCVFGACLTLAALVPGRSPRRAGPEDAFGAAPDPRDLPAAAPYAGSQRPAPELAGPAPSDPALEFAPPAGAPGEVGRQRTWAAGSPSGPRAPAPWQEASSAFEVALIAAGIRPEEAPGLRDRYEATERRRQALRTLAQDRPLTPEEQAQLDGLDEALERELGSDTYDKLRYAKGETNRVRVVGVGPGGPASDAGLLPGDVVLRYDGKRIFGVREFRAAVEAAETARGEGVVEIQVLRDGQPFSGLIRTGRPHMGLQAMRVRP